MPDLLRPIYYTELYVASICCGQLQFLTQGLRWFHSLRNALQWMLYKRDFRGHVAQWEVITALNWAH